MLEIEVKIQIKNPELMSQKILDLGATQHRARFFEENTLYDYPDQTLTKKRQAVRLRTTHQTAFLTFKDHPQKSRTFKIREEFETEVKNALQMKKIMKSLGLVPSFEYKKFRTVFRAKNLKICVDELPIGSFIELEGEQNHIVRFAESLGFSRKDFIKKDYVALLLEQERSGI
ncbi:MAG: class IV adenylate cyclase [Candidatus Aminicenantes bacterium]|jgi:adenylate cyclase class 2